MAYTINHYITDWVEESRALMQPDKVLWIDGTETQLEELRREAYAPPASSSSSTRKSCRAAISTAPRVNDVARVEGTHLHLLQKGRGRRPHQQLDGTAGRAVHDAVRYLCRVAMKGRTMYVIPYSMGPIGSPFAKIRH